MWVSFSELLYVNETFDKNLIRKLGNIGNKELCIKYSEVREFRKEIPFLKGIISRRETRSLGSLGANCAIWAGGLTFLGSTTSSEGGGVISPKRLTYLDS